MQQKMKKIILLCLICFGTVFSSLLSYMQLIVSSATCSPPPPTNNLPLVLGSILIIFIWIITVAIPAYYYIKLYKVGDRNAHQR